jgi:hypothetical protein
LFKEAISRLRIPRTELSALLVWLVLQVYCLLAPPIDLQHDSSCRFFATGACKFSHKTFLGTQVVVEARDPAFLLFCCGLARVSCAKS